MFGSSRVGCVFATGHVTPLRFYLQEDEGLDGARGQQGDDGQTLGELLQVRQVAGQEVALQRRRKRRETKRGVSV